MKGDMVIHMCYFDLLNNWDQSRVEVNYFFQLQIQLQLQPFKKFKLQL